MEQVNFIEIPMNVNILRRLKEVKLTIPLPDVARFFVKEQGSNAKELQGRYNLYQRYEEITKILYEDEKLRSYVTDICGPSVDISYIKWNLYQLFNKL